MMMRFMKRLLRLGMTMLLLLSVTAASALAAETATITLNVTNTPVRGDVLLEKTGLQLVRFEDEQDAYGNTVMARFSKTAIWLAQSLSCAPPRTSWARKAPYSIRRTS